MVTKATKDTQRTPRYYSGRYSLCPLWFFVFLVTI
jgi:hypothetical protein